MHRSFLTRIVAGTLGLALVALAATDVAGSAHADGPAIQGPNTLDTAGLPPPSAKPDLAVLFDKISCDSSPDGGPRVLVQVRVINKSDVPAPGTFYTDVKMDGVMVAGAPHQTVGPLLGTQVFQHNLAATPGLRVLKAYADATKQVDEGNEENNGAITRVMCP
jgi:hypothetical protein